MGTAKWDLILLSYVEVRENVEKLSGRSRRAGIVVVEYCHADNHDAPGGFADNELTSALARSDPALLS